MAVFLVSRLVFRCVHWCSGHATSIWRSFSLAGGLSLAYVEHGGCVWPPVRCRFSVRVRRVHVGFALARDERDDASTHAQNTLSTETTEVQVYYPFHPLHGLTVQIQRRPKRGDGAAIVADRAGKRLKIPMWMLSPSSREIRLSERAVLSKEALLSLSSVLAIQIQRDHDNLQRIAVDLCEGGHREATRTDGPDDPRSPNGTRKRKRSGRSGRSDGALSRSSIPG